MNRPPPACLKVSAKAALLAAALLCASSAWTQPTEPESPRPSAAIQTAKTPAPFPLHQWLPAAPGLLTIPLLVFLLVRLRRERTSPPASDDSLNLLIADLETRARGAADKFKTLSANYDQLDEQYNDLAQRHEQTRAELAALKRKTKTPRRPRDEQPIPVRDPAPTVLPSSEPELSSTPQRTPESIPQPPAPTPSFGSDPERDYLEAQRTSDLQPEFKRIYTPVVVTCTNLSQRGVSGIQLAFVQDSRSSLFAVANPTKALIFPSFALDPAYARDLLEGVYIYPSEFTHLTVAAAALAERKGDTFYLTRPGQFRNA